jgi:hypothetical protein
VNTRSRQKLKQFKMRGVGGVAGCLAQWIFKKPKQYYFVADTLILEDPKNNKEILFFNPTSELVKTFEKDFSQFNLTLS